MTRPPFFAVPQFHHPAAEAAFGAFVRLLCAPAFHFAHLLYLSLLFAVSFIPIGFSCVSFYAFVFVITCVCTAVWLNAMFRNVNSRFEKILANFHWICRLFCTCILYIAQVHAKREHTHYKWNSQSNVNVNEINMRQSERNRKKTKMSIHQEKNNTCAHIQI